MQATDFQPKPAGSLNSLGGPARFGRPTVDQVLDAAGQPGAAFAQALQTAQSAGSAPVAGAALSRTIAAGDTLTGIVQEQAGAMGVKLEGSQAYRLAQQLAKANRIDNPDRIFVGQQLDMRALSEQIAQTGVAAPFKPAEVANVPAQLALQRLAPYPPGRFSLQQTPSWSRFAACRAFPMLPATTRSRPTES